MNFITESFSYASNDGRIVLRARIDRPIGSEHKSFDFLNLYTEAATDFVRSKLFVKATEAYQTAVRVEQRFIPLEYVFHYFVTYFDDRYLSCVVSVLLSKATHTLTESIETVVFLEDKLLPLNQFLRVHKRNKIALDSEGHPAIVEQIDGKLIFNRLAKKG